MSWARGPNHSSATKPDTLTIAGAKPTRMGAGFAIAWADASRGNPAPVHTSAAAAPAGAQAIGTAWARVLQRLGHLRQFRDLRRFLLCTVFYQAGIQAVITLTAIYANQAMGFSMQQTLTLVLVVNLTAAAGAFLFGPVQDRIGHVRAIALTLLGWILTILFRPRTDTSELAVFDALDVAAGPVALAPVPRRIPFGFHANFVAS